MLKKKIVLILLLVFPLLVLVGFSTWIVIYEVKFQPERKVSELVEYFGTSQETTYNKSEQVPKQIDGPIIDTSRISYKYKLANEKEFASYGGPTNAGTYDVLITVEGMGECQVRFVIHKQFIKLGDDQCISIEYGKNAENERQWAGMQQIISSQIQFYNEKSEEYKLESSDYTVVGIQNGDFYYSSDNAFKNKYNTLETTDKIIGSTYLSEIKILNNNYLLIGRDTVIVKYKTVQVNDTLYTIEDALNNDGDIVLLGDSTANNTVFTAFTSLDYYKEFNYKYTLTQDSKLWITYDGLKTKTARYDSSTHKNTIYSVLYIPQKVTLDAKGEVNVCGVMAANNHRIYTRGVLFNNGTINIYNTLNAYGFVNGTGRINANPNSNIIDVMCFYNFTSGGPTLSMSNGKIFPLTCYSLHNISCELKIDYKATYQVAYDISITVDIAGNLTLVGVGGLFELSDGYVIKNVEDTTGTFYKNKGKISSYNITNQDITQRDIIDIYGKFKDNIVDISKSGQGITTGKDYAMPIGFMDISLKKDNEGNIGNGVLSANSYKFLPGSKMQINYGASLTISDGINVIFYDESYDDTFVYSNASAIQYITKHKVWYESGRTDIGAQLIVNGTLISNGNIGGLIQTTDSTGKIIIYKNVATLKIMTKLTYDGTADKFTILTGGTTAEVDDSTVKARAYLYKNDIVGDNEENIAIGTYFSIIDTNGKIGWVTEENTKNFQFEFYDGNTKLAEKNILSLDNEYTITGMEYSYDKQFYRFIEWQDENGNSLKNQIISDTTITIKCYAYFQPKEYNFEYFGEYNGNNITEYLEFSNQMENFTIENFIDGVLNITTEVLYNDKYFNGWYILIGENKIGPIDNIQIGQFKTLVDNYGDIIPLFCRFNDTQYFSITFEDNNVEHEDFKTISVENGKNVNLDSYNNGLRIYDTKTNYDRYFVGWYTTPNFIDGTEFTDNIAVTTSLTLYAKWETKTKITYQDGEELIKEYWYKNGTNIDITCEYSKEGYTFDSWNKKQDGTGTSYLNEDIGTSTFTDDIILYAQFKVNKYEITIKKGENVKEVKIKVDGTEVSTPIKADYNSIITVEFTFNANYELDKCVVTEIGTGKSYTLDGSGKTFTMPAADVEIDVSSKECLVEGTLITLANGEKVPVENIKQGDMLLVFNHETGQYDIAEVLFNDSEPLNKYTIINLVFNDGTHIKVVSEHGFFDLNLNKYVYIDSTNYKEYIGHKFFTTAYENGTLIKGSITLTESYLTDETVRVYSPVTKYHLNYFAENVLSMPGGIEGLFNIFEYNSDLKYNEEKKQQDIEQYGLLTYDDFKDYVSYEIYESFPALYFNVSIAKGLLTWEQIMYYIERYAPLM